jgi:hypothetical protein
LNLPASCCDVGFLATFVFFPFAPLLLTNDFLLLQALDWTLLVKLAGFLNGLRLLKDHQRESKVSGLIPGAVVRLCFFRIVLSTLEKPLIFFEDL